MLINTKAGHESSNSLDESDINQLVAYLLQVDDSEPTVGPRVCGDQNDDGVFDILDAVASVKAAMNGADPGTIRSILGDLNQNGSIDEDDVQRGLLRIVGKAPVVNQCGPP